MSLENSQYTFHSLQSANQAAFRKEVDRITKEADHVESSDDEAPPDPPDPVPAKRGRFTESQESNSSSQRRQRQPRAVSGIIHEVVLENFLCHSHYKVTLNKEINFIVGRNGSGKSAILTALVVALGGNASVTGRGVALKDFVKHNCSSAVVTCVVSNAGALNYRRDVYGDKIIVVRTIQSQGGSSIKLKTEKDKLVSSRMEDLRSMTLQLGIQVDNPISVLDQNTARHFLNQSKSSNKFELFMRATNLETLQKLYVDIALAVDTINQEIRKKERQLIDNNAEVLDIKSKYDMLQSLETDKMKSDNLKMELLWAKVRDSMISLEHVQNDLKKVQREKEQLTNMLSSEDQSEPLLQELESAKAAKQALDDQGKEILNDLKDLKNQFLSISEKEDKCKADKNQTEIRIKKIKETIGDYKAEIQSQEKKVLPEHVNKRRQQREEIHKLQRCLEQYEKDHKANEAEKEKLLVNSRGITDTLKTLESQERKFKADLNNYNTKLQGLESTESNLSLFGPCMPELVKQIEGSNQFKKKPVGPLGSYVRMKDSKWALAVESVIKGCLQTFVVDNLEDEKLLRSMIQKICKRGRIPGLRRTPFITTPYDTSRTAARTSEYCNVLDVIEVSNVVAQNMLIELCNLETTMLIPTDDECYRLLSNRHTVPRNCRRALTLNADQYFPAPNYKTYASTQHSVNVLQSSRIGAIRELKKQIEETDNLLEGTKQALTAASSEHKSTCAQIQQARSAVAKCANLILGTKSKLEELKDVEQADTHTISELREELAEQERKLQENETMLQEIPGKLQTLGTEKDQMKQKAANLRNEMTKIKVQVESCTKKQENCREQLEEIKCAQVGKKQKLEQAVKQEERYTNECHNLGKEHSERREAAEKYEAHLQSEAQDKNIEFNSCSNTNRDMKLIDQELRVIVKRLASVEKTLGQNSETIEKQYHEKLGAYNHTKNKIKDFKSNVAYLSAALDERKSLYHTQKNLMCAVVSHQFTRVLRFRNCTGNVKVNFKDKILEINVGPVDEGERAGLGTASLSGGERSYATMAFVIALWNVTELPFYYLDEFDVFMDMLNRQTVLTLLLRFAKQKSGYQFGFLTPLDTTAITGSSRVSIFKLSDPRSDV